MILQIFYAFLGPKQDDGKPFQNTPFWFQKVIKMCNFMMKICSSEDMTPGLSKTILRTFLRPLLHFLCVFEVPSKTAKIAKSGNFPKSIWV